MYTSTLLALVAYLSAVSARPQSSSSSGSSSSSSASTSSTSGKNGSQIFADSLNKLYLDGSTWIGNQLQWDNRNYSVYSIFASTGFPGDDDDYYDDNSTSTSTSSSSSSYSSSIPSSNSSVQLPITQLEIQWLPNGNNSTKLIDLDNYSGNRTGDWTYETDEIDPADSKAYRVWLPTGHVQDVDTTINLLAAHGQKGPWDQVTISTLR